MPAYERRPLALSLIWFRGRRVPSLVPIMKGKKCNQLHSATQSQTWPEHRSTWSHNSIMTRGQFRARIPTFGLGPAWVEWLNNTCGWRNNVERQLTGRRGLLHSSGIVLTKTMGRAKRRRFLGWWEWDVSDQSMLLSQLDSTADFDCTSGRGGNRRGWCCMQSLDSILIYTATWLEHSSRPLTGD